MCWPSSESQLDNSDFGDTASVGDFQDSNLPVKLVILLVSKLIWIVWEQAIGNFIIYGLYLFEYAQSSSLLSKNTVVNAPHTHRIR